jgi:hypothetical protein
MNRPFARRCEPPGMRLWTLHPRYLDAKGLVACWREALLAQKVLSGATRGYRNHPQLVRFRASADPMAAIGVFLHEIAAEAARRGYNFDARKIVKRRRGLKLRELKQRSPAVARKWRDVEKPQAHPLFRLTTGGVCDWEKR